MTTLLSYFADFGLVFGLSLLWGLAVSFFAAGVTSFTWDLRSKETTRVSWLIASLFVGIGTFFGVLAYFMAR